MKQLRLILAGFAAALLSLTTFAQSEEQLAKLLKQHPNADANKDGKLSVEEAANYRRELRAKRNKAARNGEETENTVSAKKPAPTYKNVSYGPHERNVFDFWAAKSSHPTPLVVFIHGGGFVNEARTARTLP